MIDLFGHETCIVEIEQYIDLINLQLHFYRADVRAYLQGGVHMNECAFLLTMNGLLCENGGLHCVNRQIYIKN